MTLLGMKVYLTLLWGISVLFSTETRSASIPETSSSSVSSTAEPNGPLTAAHDTETQPATGDPTRKRAEVTAAATAETTVSPTVETQKAVVSEKSDSSKSSTASLFVVNTAALTTSSAGPRLSLGASTGVTTAAGDAQPFRDVTETAKPTEGQLQQQSHTASTDATAPATVSVTAGATTTTATTYAAHSATVAVSSPQPRSVTEHDVTAKLTPSPTSDHSTQAPLFISSPSASTAATMRTNPSHGASPAPDPTSLPSRTSTTSAELSSTSQSASDTRTLIPTSQFPDTTGLISITESPATTLSNDTSVSTPVISTSPALIPHVPKRLPMPTTKSTPATTAARHEVSKSTPSAEAQPCSTQGVVKRCLIVIASLAGLATVFMVSTIALCAKLSARKYRVKKPQQATELMCISALLPESTYTYTRQRSPVTNGVRVYPSRRDSDEDGGDDLTLSSFLPENA